MKVHVGQVYVFGRLTKGRGSICGAIIIGTVGLHSVHRHAHCLGGDQLPRREYIVQKAFGEVVGFLKGSVILSSGLRVAEFFCASWEGSSS